MKTITTFDVIHLVFVLIDRG